MYGSLVKFYQNNLPQRTLTWLGGKLANSQTQWLKNWLIRRYIAHFGIDMSLALEPEPSNYACFNDFFIRRLKPELRPISCAAGQICSPVDGTISQLGRLRDGRLFQAKGFDFSAEQLLGGSQRRAAVFSNGRFITLYLSPADYHRIHMPISGQLSEMVYVPGKLFSVNPRATQSVKNLFGRNERVICLFDTELGPMAIVLVGALIVGSIHTQWAGTITPPRYARLRSWQYPEKDQDSIRLAQGDELGFFRLGSTAIVLFASDNVLWDSSLMPNAFVQMGQLIATNV